MGGYSISFGNSRNGQGGVIHNFDVGDDYFTNYNLQLTPTYLSRPVLDSHLIPVTTDPGSPITLA